MNIVPIDHFRTDGIFANLPKLQGARVIISGLVFRVISTNPNRRTISLELIGVVRTPLTSTPPPDHDLRNPPPTPS